MADNLHKLLNYVWEASPHNKDRRIAEVQERLLSDLEAMAEDIQVGAVDIVGDIDIEGTVRAIPLEAIRKYFEV